MPLALKYSKAISDIAEYLYDFLPGNPHPYANQSISFKGVAYEMGLSKFWMGGSKLPAITALLSHTYEHERGKFCNLIISIVNKGITYRAKKQPVSKKEIITLNDLIAKLDFKIPELWDKSFLDSLPYEAEEKPVQPIAKQVNYATLLTDFTVMLTLEPQSRGFAFEKFLNVLFDEFGLNPRKSFKLLGEQIDGSFELDGEYYLVEAKWQEKPLGNSDLLTFNGKIAGKSAWSRGIVISYSGFSKDGLDAFGKGRATNLITMDGQDLYAILSKNISLTEALKKKIRWTAETGEIAKSVFELFV